MSACIFFPIFSFLAKIIFERNEDNGKVYKRTVTWTNFRKKFNRTNFSWFELHLKVDNLLLFVIGDYQEYFDAGHGHNEFKGENISSSGCLCWHPSSKSPTSILLVNIGWFGWFVWRWDYSNSYSNEGTYFKNFVKFAIHTKAKLF